MLISIPILIDLKQFFVHQSVTLQLKKHIMILKIKEIKQKLELIVCLR